MGLNQNSDANAAGQNKEPERNGYYFSNNWFDFIRNTSLVKPIHTALFTWYIDLNNRIGWNNIEFGAPTEHAMEALGIANRNTFKNTFNDLIEWGFIELISTSVNQYTARKIRLCTFNNEQPIMNSQSTSNHTSNAHIYKPLKNKTFKIEEEEVILGKDFENFEEALEIYLKDKLFFYFKKKYGLEHAAVIDLFKEFWEYQEAIGQLHYTSKKCFPHFYSWYPLNLKAKHDAKLIGPQWKANWVEMKNNKKPSTKMFLKPHEEAAAGRNELDYFTNDLLLRSSTSNTNNSL